MKHPTRLIKRALLAVTVLTTPFLTASCTTTADSQRLQAQAPAAPIQESAKPAESKPPAACVGEECIAQANTQGLMSAEEIKRKLAPQPPKKKSAEQPSPAAASEGEASPEGPCNEYTLCNDERQRSLAIITMGEAAAGKAAVPTKPHPKPAKPKPKTRYVPRTAPSDTFENLPSLDLHINFEFNSAVLTSDGIQQAQELGKALVQILGEDSQARFMLVGHTDSTGSDQYNLALSQERARSVKSYLIQNFSIAGGALTAEGMGERKPLSPATDEESQKLNRRVEVKRLR